MYHVPLRSLQTSLSAIADVAVQLLGKREQTKFWGMFCLSVLIISTYVFCDFELKQ